VDHSALHPYCGSLLHAKIADNHDPPDAVHLAEDEIQRFESPEELKTDWNSISPN
jgi:hypothetical protein